MGLQDLVRDKKEDKNNHRIIREQTCPVEHCNLPSNPVLQAWKVEEAAVIV